MYVVMMMATFDSEEDARAMKAATETLSNRARRSGSGAGERTSWCGVFDESDDGVLTELEAWSFDNAGVVRSRSLPRLDR